MGKEDFPGGPVVKTPSSQCRGHRFDPWSGNKDLACCMVWPKKKKKKREKPGRRDKEKGEAKGRA